MPWAEYARVHEGTGAAIIVAMRFALAAATVLVVTLIGGCLPASTIGSLAPTLTVGDNLGVAIPMQNGMPVPTFSWQPRPRLDLDGEWLVETATLDTSLTMTARDRSLGAIEAEAGGRQLPDYDDGAWQSIEVPGTTNPPPDGEEGGAWYRHAFAVPRSWRGEAAMLKFGSANYVADVWLNGTWLGYHEGGSTPFAFEAGAALRPGEENVLAVRVDTIPLGTRSDIVPWGIIDWWNYGGITGPVWMEAPAPTHVARADVVPHLDAVDVQVTLWHSARLGAGDEVETEASAARLRLSIYAARVDDGNVLDPDARALVADDEGPLAMLDQEVDLPSPGEASSTTLSLLFGAATAWSPARPALYVLRIELIPDDAPVTPFGAEPSDELWDTFGIRHVAVDPDRSAVLLNGDPAFFRGVGLHDEALRFDSSGNLLSGGPAETPEQAAAELADARAVGANLIRTGHEPADPTTLMLADRLGFAVWEEIPLYHASPLIFDRTMRRGIPQQMVREMALRDMNRPSVLFHGFANESTGAQERTDALAELHAVDRAIDGTRLTGQAAYGWQPDDPTSAPLDVVGFTFYYGVFYGEDPGPDTSRALRAAHEANPGKPIMVLEFGRWADLAFDEERQRVIFDETYPAFERYRGDRAGGFVAAATWWTLHDFATQLGGIGVENFGLYRPDGSLRPAGVAATDTYSAPAGAGADLMLDPELDRPRARPERAIGDWTLVGYLAYAIGLSLAVMGVGLLALTHRGGRAGSQRR
jgi:beta-glucuronidase